MGVLDSIKKATSSIGSAFNPVSDLVGAGVSAFGAYSQQQTSEKMARDQMQFQKKMSDTAHQRQVADLRKAGLNPVLSASQGGAASPGGAMGVAQNIGQAGVTAMALKKMYAETANIHAQTRKITADTNPMEFILSNVETLAKMFGTTPEAIKGLISSTAKDIEKGLKIPIEKKKESAFPKYQLRDEYLK